MNESLIKLSEAVIKGDAEKARILTQEVLEQGVRAEAVLNEGLIAGMNVVGIRFKANEMFVPEVLLAARAMHSGLNLLKPILAESKVQEKGVFLLGTVKGDVHDIGKNLLGMMFEGAGFKVIDLGINVPAEKFVAAIKEHSPDILGLSALLTTTMPAMKEVIETLKSSGLRGRVKVLVGGAPVTEKFAKEIGADGYASDAASAVQLAVEILEASN